MVVRVFSRAKNVLVTHVVRLLIGHPVSTADTDGVTTVEVPEGVHAVTAALPVAALEVAALIEDDLEKERETCITQVIVRYILYINWLQYACADCRGHCSPLNKLNYLFMSPPGVQAPPVCTLIFSLYSWLNRLSTAQI